MKTPLSKTLLVLGLVFLSTACKPQTKSAEQSKDSGKSKSSGAPAPTNRIELSPDVMQNLGIQFAKAEKRRLETRLEIRGRLELPRPNQWTARAAAHGRVRVAVTDLQRVKAGEILASLATPELRAIQRAAAKALDSRTRADMAELELKARVPVLESLRAASKIEIEDLKERSGILSRLFEEARLAESGHRDRLARLQGLAAENPLVAPELVQIRQSLVEASETAARVQLQSTELRASLAEREAEATRLRIEAETMASRQRLVARQQAAADLSLRQQIEALATITGRGVELLSRTLEDGSPAWQKLEVLEITAPRDGIVSALHVANDEWVEEGKDLVELVDVSELHFQGELPEAALAGLPLGSPVEVRVLASPDVALGEALRLAPRTNSEARSIIVEAIVPNAERQWPAGLAATASVVVSRATEAEVVVPEDCVTRDGLEWILFRRDPANPSLAIRLPVSLGRRSNGWVEVLSGLLSGDEVVSAGLHQLKQVGIGKAASGHFHADGSWHDDSEEDK